MGLIKKFSDLVRSNLNNWLTQAEDPQKLAELAIFEAQKNQEKAKKLLISAHAALNLVNTRGESLALHMAELLKKAQNRLAENDEEAAREILEQKQVIERQMAEASEEKSLHEQSISTIKRGLSALEQHINNLKSQAAEGEDHVNKTDAFDTFERMEQKIEANEAESQAFSELLKLSELRAFEDKLSFGSKASPAKVLSLEEELEELKKKL